MADKASMGPAKVRKSEEQRASAGSWPAYLIVVLVLGAAFYAFSHRPPPPFPATAVHPDRVLINGIAKSGSRLIAAGELGHILIADAPDGPWHEAKVEPARGSMFTRAIFIDDKTALAVGHDGWIVRSEDRGETWKEVAFNAERPDPLLAVAGPFDGKLFAVGNFGLFMTSTDQGRTWQTETLAILGKGGAPAPVTVVDPDADPFANFGKTADSQADRHLNGLVRASDGSLLLVGERGLLLQSRDNGQNWQPLDSIYAGTFFGALALPPNKLLAFGMRGNAFVSSDLGKTWKKAVTPMAVSLYDAAVLANGEIVMVGDINTVFASKDGGEHFTLALQTERRGVMAGLSAVLPLGDGELLAAGDGGVLRLRLDGGKNGTAAGAAGGQP
jgi:photosystem II stability/assembly factor-like uncharacterized protein